MTKYKPKTRTVPLGSAAWKRLRAQVLAEEPLCRWCLAQGLYVASTDVDHINNDGDDNRRENLTGMCHSCHSIKTAQDMGKGTTRGHGLNGLPLDPAHPWNAARSAPERCMSERSRGTTPPRTAPDLLS